MVVSSTDDRCPGGRVAQRPTAPKWWQLYVFEDRAVDDDMLARVVDAGYEAICLTVDLPVFGLRHRDTRNGFEPPIGGASSRVAVGLHAVVGRHRMAPGADTRTLRSW